MDRIEVLDKLNKAIDDLIIEGFSNLDLYVAGSASISLREENFRQTMDIDLAKAVEVRAKKILLEYQINDRMATSADPNISDDLRYVDQAVDLIVQKRSIRVFLVWEEFVLILKGFHAARSKDLQDVESMKGKLDSSRLDKSMELIIKSRERHGQREPFIEDFKNIVLKLKGAK